MALARPIHVLIADDHQLFRNGISSLFEDVSDILIVGEAENGAQSIEKFKSLQPDIVILDVSMPDMNGFEVLQHLQMENVNVKAIFLTMHDSQEYILHAYKSGAMGLISKNTIKGELVYAIKSVFDGAKYFGRQLTEEKLKEIEYKFKKITGHFADDYIHLTVKERQILVYVSAGQTSTEIAKLMNLSKRSIDHYRARMMLRLEIKSLPEFISYAIKYANTNKVLGND
ncbi:MAG: LuxR family transcriptional regulator [Ignavibacteria bacterium]|nr:MAG: LuxR family transcriptional regulator [Ignavibacteria bacterium]KAF0156904.1 MAG: LuxR family transcriptional regulator [Ignavibacteria bacterium]